VEKFAKFFISKNWKKKKRIIFKTPNFQCLELRGEVSRDNNPSVDFFLNRKREKKKKARDNNPNV